MILTILVCICIGYDLGAIVYYNGPTKKKIRTGFGVAMAICTLALILRLIR